jgi:hypothetical protein
MLESVLMAQIGPTREHQPPLAGQGTAAAAERWAAFGSMKPGAVVVLSSNTVV